MKLLSRNKATTREPSTHDYTEPTVPRKPFNLGEGDIQSKVYTAIGAASMCWDTVVNAGVFNSDRAKEIGDALIAAINPPSREARAVGLKAIFMKYGINDDELGLDLLEWAEGVQTKAG